MKQYIAPKWQKNATKILDAMGLISVEQIRFLLNSDPVWLGRVPNKARDEKALTHYLNHSGFYHRDSGILYSAAMATNKAVSATYARELEKERNEALERGENVEDLKTIAPENYKKQKAYDSFHRDTANTVECIWLLLYFAKHAAKQLGLKGIEIDNVHGYKNNFFDLLYLATPRTTNHLTFVREEDVVEEYGVKIPVPKQSYEVHVEQDMSLLKNFALDVKYVGKFEEGVDTFASTLRNMFFQYKVKMDSEQLLEKVVKDFEDTQRIAERLKNEQTYIPAIIVEDFSTAVDYFQEYYSTFDTKKENYQLRFFKKEVANENEVIFTPINRKDIEAKIVELLELED